TPYSSPDGLNNVLLGSHTNRQIVAVEGTHIFSPSLVNSLRVGFNREGAAVNQNLKAINPLAADLSLGAVPGRFAAQVSVSGLSGFTGGLGGNPSFFFYWNSFQAYDDAFLTKGLHSLKFGAAIERMQMNSTAFSDINGGFHFGSLPAFLTNHPSRLTAALPELVTPRGLRQTLFGAYAQDDWRWHPNLTLNLGLRYEMTTVPTEVQGKLATLINFTDPKPHLGNPFFMNPTLRNFEPRAGFAWDPFHNGKTAVRGGFGIFDVQPLPYEFALLTNRSAPFYVDGNASNLPAGSFYTGAFSLLGANSLQETYVEHDPPRNYVMQWNFNVQRELVPNLTAMAGYVGSHGVHQPFRSDDVDIVLPAISSAGYVWPSPVGSGTTLNPNFGEIRALMYSGSSFYDALELQLTKRMSHGLQIESSYTWAKSIDTSSGTLAGDGFSNSPSSLEWFNLGLNRGLSDFNIGRILVINGTWQVPAPKSATGPLAWVTSGWELGGIYKASDGVPFSATFGTDGDVLGQNSSDPWDFPNRLVGAGCQPLVNPGNPNNYTKTRCFAIPTAPSTAFYNKYCDPSMGVAPQCFNLRGNAGRNVLIGPGTSNLDFSIFKNNPVRRISESFNVQFRAEIFNILNRANFAVPVTPDNTDIFNSAGAPTGVAGLLTSTTTAAREIQFAIKLLW
ncbi:MAG: TonB-dependent receptor domain-containing protein, partial [Terriglobia bacterium]